jgi:hypothetical protein
VSTTYQFCSRQANTFEVYWREITKPILTSPNRGLVCVDFSFDEYVQLSTCSTTYNPKVRRFAVLHGIPALSRRDRLESGYLTSSFPGIASLLGQPGNHKGMKTTILIITGLECGGVLDPAAARQGVVCERRRLLGNSLKVIATPFFILHNRSHRLTWHVR